MADKPADAELERRKAWFERYVQQLEQGSVRADPENGPYRCPCCHGRTLPERGAFAICPVSFWEDEGQDDQDGDVVRGGPNGSLSLRHARTTFGSALVRRGRVATSG